MDVVIPAHDEESTIGRSVARITRPAPSGPVVVVANACRDRTADAARGPGGVTVLETDVPGKAHALNLGDSRCTGFPRAYLDADVELDAVGLDTLGAALDRTGAMLAVPEFRMVDDGSTWATRRYLGAWRALPAVRGGTAGRGVYVLSEAGHAEVFPLREDLIADDGYVERVVGPDRRVVVPGTVVVVHAPRTLPDMVRRRVRVMAGNRQLARLGLPAHGGGSGLRVLARLVRSREVTAVDAAVFTVTTVVVRAVDLVRRLRGREVRWGSERAAAPTA